MLKVKAPEFVGIKGWINSKPLTLEKLKGKLILVDFWTYTCINCMRTIPYLKQWHQKYSKKGLVIIGIHSPEFSFEKDPQNVKKAVKKMGIKYPVALDSSMETWRAFDNSSWPAKFLIRDGYIIYVHFGEGNYEITEERIQRELGIRGKVKKEKYAGYMFDQSPETYAGFTRNPGLGSGMVCRKKKCFYVDPGKNHMPNTIYPDGRWEHEREYLELKEAPGKISYRFYAREVNMVMEPVGKSAKADIFVDNKKQGSVSIDSPAMYNVYKKKKYEEHELALVFRGKVRVYEYTFG